MYTHVYKYLFKIHTCVHTHVCTYTLVYTHTHTHMCTHTHVYTHTHAYTHTPHTCVHTHTPHTCAHTHLCTHTHVYTHTHTHTHTHTPHTLSELLYLEILPCTSNAYFSILVNTWTTYRLAGWLMLVTRLIRSRILSHSPMNSASSLYLLAP